MNAGSKKTVFLDRDGVLNRALVVDGKTFAPRTLQEFEINPDIGELARLKKLGFQLIVATNQPDVANGIVTRAFVEDLHARILKVFPLDDIEVCYHNAEANCECRKPKPGMLIHARDKHGIDMAQSYMVGDRWRDVNAGAAAGCRTIFIDHGYKDDAPHFAPDFTCTSLVAAIEWIESQEAETFSKPLSPWGEEAKT